MLTAVSPCSPIVKEYTCNPPSQISPVPFGFERNTRRIAESDCLFWSFRSFFWCFLGFFYHFECFFFFPFFFSLLMLLQNGLCEAKRIWCRLFGLVFVDCDDSKFLFSFAHRSFLEQIAQKYDPQKEEELRIWIQDTTGCSIDPDFQKGLKNGVILCE